MKDRNAADIRDAGPYPWNAERLEDLRRMLQDDGYSFSKIAAELTKKYGRKITRNACIGVAGRHCLKSGKPKGVGQKYASKEVRIPFGGGKPTRDVALANLTRNAKERKEKRMTAIPLPPPKPLPDDVEICPLHVTREDRAPDGCQWITTDAVDAVHVRFCGAPQADPTSSCLYCAGHKARAHIKPTSRGGHFALSSQRVRS